MVLFKNGTPSQRQIEDHYAAKVAKIAKGYRRIFDYQSDCWLTMKTYEPAGSKNNKKSGPFQENNAKAGDKRVADNNHKLLGYILRRPESVPSPK